MAGQVIRMLGAVTGGTESAIAQIDIPSDGVIVGVDWSARWSLDADEEVCRAQLSFRSAYTDSNDDRGIISEVSGLMSLVTSGALFSSVNKYLNLPSISVMGGERLYLHSIATAAVTGSVVCLVHFDLTAMSRVSMRRA